MKKITLHETVGEASAFVEYCLASDVEELLRECRAGLVVAPYASDSGLRAIEQLVKKLDALLGPMRPTT